MKNREFFEIDENLTKSQILDKVKTHYNYFRKKFKQHYYKFVISNLIVVLVTSLIIVLNLFALSLNKINETKLFFVLIAIFTSLSALFTALLIVFNVVEKNKSLKGKIQFLSNLIKSLEKNVIDIHNVKKELQDRLIN